MNRPRVSRAALVLVAAGLAGSALAAPPAGTRVVERTIHVKLSSTGNDVSFDQQTVRVKLGFTVRLRYKNDAPPDSHISHNVALVKPGRADALLEILRDHEYDIASVKGSPDLLALSRILAPGMEDTITFAPPAPGDYEYVCLMPGHGDMMGMRGILAVR